MTNYISSLKFVVAKSHDLNHTVAQQINSTEWLPTVYI